jgi:hypothetical protein
MRRYFLRSGFALLKRRYKWLFLVALLQLIYLYLALSQLEDLFNLSEEFPAQRSVNETQEELDTRQYLEALIKGKSWICLKIRFKHNFQLFKNFYLPEIMHIFRNGRGSSGG